MQKLISCNCEIINPFYQSSSLLFYLSALHQIAVVFPVADAGYSKLDTWEWKAMGPKGLLIMLLINHALKQWRYRMCNLQMPFLIIQFSKISTDI